MLLVLIIPRVFEFREQEEEEEWYRFLCVRKILLSLSKGGWFSLNQSVNTTGNREKGTPQRGSVSSRGRG